MAVTFYLGKTINLEYYEDFLDEKELVDLLSKLSIFFIGSTTRKNKTFGDKGLVYVINWYGTQTKRPVLEWPLYLLPLKEKLEAYTNQKYNICVAQFYPNGKIGINKHRDKEMVKGTSICGISLGATRTLTMEREEKISIPLKSGSLYVFYPPTNDYWTHCIEKDSVRTGRISLTFRNYT